MSFKPEINDGSGWGQNAQVFATREEAEVMARDIYNRWMAARDWRVVEVDEPVTHKLTETENGEWVLSTVKEEPCSSDSQ